MQAVPLPTRQRVVLLRQFGGPDCLTVVERPVPEPGAGEVLVKTLAASVQFTDVMLRKGQYPDLKDKPPLVLGYDLVGEVVKLGPGVTSPALGQRVADLTVTGSYSQYRILKSERVVVVDAALDPAEATTLILSWMTAYQLLHRDAGIKKGQKALVIGAAGAVGQALLVLGRLAGCDMWGAARAPHAGLVRALGATYLDSDRTDYGEVLAGGFDVAFDGIGERGFSRSWRAIGPHGHLSAFGVSAAVQRDMSIVRVGWWLAKLWLWNTFAKGRSTRFYSITTARSKHPDWFVTDLGELFGMLKRGVIKPRVAERIGLDAVTDAHIRIERGGLDGKIVLVPAAS